MISTMKPCKKQVLFDSYLSDENKNDITGIKLFIHMPSEETEIIINPKVKEKLDYIDRTYNDDLVHSNSDRIKIINWQFIYGSDINMSFSTALKRLKEGCTMKRGCWSEKRIYATSGSVLDVDDLKPETKAFVRPFIAGRSDQIEIKTHIDMIDNDGTIIIGWSPSQEDMFAEDWEVVQ